MDDILCSYSEGVSELSLLEDMARTNHSDRVLRENCQRKRVCAKSYIDIDLEIDKRITILRKPQLDCKPRKLSSQKL